MNFTHFCLALLVVCIWGFNFVAVRVCLDGVPPLFLVTLRFLLLSLPAVFFIKRPKTSLTKLTLYGLIMFAFQFGLLFVGMYLGIAPGIASLILQIQVFFTVVFGFVFFQERPSLFQFGGCFISFIGLGIVAMHLQGNVSLGGFILIMASALCSSLGSFVSKKMGKINTFSLVIWGSLIAWPPILLLSLHLEGYEAIRYAIAHLKPLSIAAIFYITYGSTLVGYGLWSYLIHHYPLTTMGPFMVLVPIVAITGSVLCLGEPLQTWKILAAFFVIGGLSLNFFAKKISAYVKLVR